MKRIGLLGIAAVLTFAASPAAADYPYRDGQGNLLTILAGKISGKTIPYAGLIDVSGNPLGTNSNPVYVAFPSAQHVICDSGCGGGGGGGGLSVTFGLPIGLVGTPVGFKDATGNFQPLLGDTTNGQWVNITNTSVPVTGTISVGGTLPAYAATPTFNLGTLNGAATAANQTAVQGSAAGGTAAANSVLFGGIYNSTPLSLTNGQQAGAQLDANGYLKVNVVVGGGTGGTSSTFGAAYPSLGTAVGMSVGGNMVAFTGTGGNLNVQCANCSGSGASATDLAAFSAGSSVFAPAGGVFNDGLATVSSGQQAMGRITNARALHVNLRNATGTEIATAGAPLQVSLANTGANATAIKVDGSAATQPVSGTVAVTQAVAGALNATVDPSSAAVWGLISQGSATSGQIGRLSLAAVATAAPSYTNGQSSALSLTTAGALRVDNSAVIQPVSQSGTWNLNNISGTISLPTGAATSALQASNVSQGSATSGQTGYLGFAAVCDSAPTYTNAQSSPLSLTPAGALRVDGSAVTQPVSIAGTVTVAQATAGNLNATVVGTGTFAVQAAQSGAWTVSGTGTAGTAATGVLTVQGIASMTPLLSNPGTASLWGVNTLGSTTSGQSGQLAMGAVTTAAPTYTTAQSNALSLTTAGALRVDGSGVTQPVSLASTTITGTVAVTQSGSWSLAANQSVNVAQINGVTPLMGNGATGTGSQRVTIANDNTVPTGWPTATNQTAAAAAKGEGATGAAVPSGAQYAGLNVGGNLVGWTGIATGPTVKAATVAIVDASGNQITSFGGSGGTASSFGSAFPSTGTAIGMSNGTNMVAFRSTAYGTTPTGLDALAVNAFVTNTNANGSATSANSSPVVIASDQAAVAVKSASGAFASGSFASGAYASGSLASGAVVDITNFSTPITPATATATKGVLLGMQYNSTQATFTNGQQGSVQGSSRGALYVATGADTFNVTVNAALPAGSNIIGNVRIDQTTPGTTNGVQDASTGSTGSTAMSTK